MGKITSASFVANMVSPGFVGYLPENLERFAVAMGVAPVAQTKVSTGSYIVRTRTDQQRVQHNGLRVGGGMAQVSEVGQATAAFACYDKADRRNIDANEIRDAAGIYDPVRQNTLEAMASVIKLMELDFAGTYFTTGVWGTDQTAPNPKWNANLAGSPISDVTTALGTLDGFLDGMTGAIGVCGTAVYRQLAIHPELHDFAGVLNAQGVTPLTADQIAAKLGLDALLVSSLTHVTSKEGATAAQSKIVGDGFLVLKTASKAFEGEPHALALVQNEPLQAVTKELANAKEGSRYVEAWARYDYVLVDANLGVFIQDCLT